MIRETRQETQAEFADQLNGRAEVAGLPGDYTFTEVSLLETARKRLTFEAATLVALLDPERRGWTWIVYGKAVKLSEDASRALAGEPKRASR